MRNIYLTVLALPLGLVALFAPVRAQAPAQPTTAGSVIVVPSTTIATGDLRSGNSLIPLENSLVPESSRRATNLSLVFPLQGPSIHADYVGTEESFSWADANSGQINNYGVVDGKFVYQPGDTWFIYGLFGHIQAIDEDYNVKYPAWGNRHNGIDIATRTGTPVISASDGGVVFTGTKAGNTIVVQTNNFQITYAHLDKISVAVGEGVRQGQVIGYTGSSGTINPHLHLQIDRIINGERWGVNPAKYLLPELESATMPDVPANRYSDGGTLTTLNTLADDFRW